MDYDVVRQAVNLARLVGATDGEVRFIAEKIYLERHPGTQATELPRLLEPILGCGARAENPELV
ncbi:hypothetical protein [Azospirillum sp. SYSU D00513]|uniref:hypothetical protein n=1 Tax=Azospirillum sp. SYSU D00513 TaxID=2812561 RepID=UPI001A97CABB|nr:hypothetical protein [Azospirillum sp. SYSU D00513]